jgi:protein-disulfide isomerase
MFSTRRNLLVGGGAAIGVAAVGGAYVFSRGSSPTAVADPAGGGELMEAGPLGEKALGDPDAPVVIIEYASMTCPHCAAFHRETFPELRSEYIETGKVYHIFREFPLDPLATAAFMLGRCLEDDRYFAFISALFTRQDTWSRAQNPEEALFQMARQAGFSRDSFNACLTNQQILDGVNWVKDRAAERFDVRSTPTFFINGEMVRGAVPFSQFQEIIEGQLPS